MHLVATGFIAAGAKVIVACRMEEREVKPWADKLAASGCRVVDIPAEGIRHASHAASLARDAGVRRVFFPNFDSVIYEMGKLGATHALAGLDVGGIWLRPDLTPLARGPVQRVFEKLIRSRANKTRRKQARAVRNNLRGLVGFLPENRQLTGLRLFFTSRAAASEVGKRLPGETSLICDPWLSRCDTSKADARAWLGINASRMILLHAGTSRQEKGLSDVCKALSSLDPSLSDRLLLLRAGKVDASDAPMLKELVDRGVAHSLDRYLSEEELSHCFAACDWVLLPYRNQSESSGILIHAAAQNRPVIASNYGWIGQCTHDYGLGLSFRHLDTGALAEQLAKVARDNITECSPAGMNRFADANSPESFQKTLISLWLYENGTTWH